MYVTKHHQLDDREAMFSLMDAYPLGAWVCAGQDGLVANHVPFLLDRNQGPAGTLIGHVARANPVWRALHTATPSVVLFQGPQSYITPGWYPGKAEHGKVVPTWNYMVAGRQLYQQHITGAQLGNFPQAFSHIGFINAVLYLFYAEGREIPVPDPIGSKEHRNMLGKRHVEGVDHRSRMVKM